MDCFLRKNTFFSNYYFLKNGTGEKCFFFREKYSGKAECFAIAECFAKAERSAKVGWKVGLGWKVKVGRKMLVEMKFFLFIVVKECVC